MIFLLRKDLGPIGRGAGRHEPVGLGEMEARKDELRNRCNTPTQRTRKKGEDCILKPGGGKGPSFFGGGTKISTRGGWDGVLPMKRTWERKIKKKKWWPRRRVWGGESSKNWATEHNP